MITSLVLLGLVFANLARHILQHHPEVVNAVVILDLLKLQILMVLWLVKEFFIYGPTQAGVFAVVHADRVQQLHWAYNTVMWSAMLPSLGPMSTQHFVILPSDLPVLNHALLPALLLLPILLQLLIQHQL